MNSNIGSSLTSNADTALASAFPAVTDLQLVLPVSVYLIGYILGPIFYGPMSEALGRRPVLLPAYIIHISFTLACALAPSFPWLLVFRFLAGTAAAAPIAVFGGVYADILADPRQRGWCIALLMSFTNIGPCLGPIISGYVSVISWRWSYWVGLILLGATFPFILWLPETFAPILQEKRLSKTSQILPEAAEGTGYTEQNTPTHRPLSFTTIAWSFQMLFSESILAVTCLYLSFVYSIFYLYLQAYPVIFKGASSVYKLDSKTTGLAFLPIGIGALIAGGIFFIWDFYLTRATKLGRQWTRRDEMRRLPLACIGGPLLVIALFWLGWTCKQDIHWLVPACSGLLFGMGFVLVFIAMLNYLTDAYEIYAASAHGMASTCRSISGALLPFAGRKMYVALGTAWASSLLAFVGLGLSIVPFILIRYGEKIRAGSRFATQIQSVEAA
ncbi:hypothetical protein N7540_002673 [Penicillium herquei]|nr:hypothetical protein N7540_002673 [Penicillium herquei]